MVTLIIDEDCDIKINTFEEGDTDFDEIKSAIIADRLNLKSVNLLTDTNITLNTLNL